MISKALFRELIKVQFYLYSILLFAYQLYDGLYGQYWIDPKAVSKGMILSDEASFSLSYKYAVIGNTLVWLLAILVVVFIQFSFLRKKENRAFLGCLPIQRQKIIVTTYVSGLTVLAGGFLIHALAVLAHNQSKLNGMLLGSLLRTAIAFWCIYTVLFALQAFILQNKWWVILIVLTAFAAGTGMIVTTILYECLPSTIRMQYSMNAAQYWYGKCKAYAFNYLLPKNTVNAYLPADPTFLFAGMTIALLVIGALCVFFAIRCYCKADDADTLSVFAIPIPRPVCILYGAFVGYGSSVFIIYGMLYIVSILRALTAYQIFADSVSENIMRSLAVVIVIMMALIGGFVTHRIIVRRKKKEGSYA